MRRGRKKEITVHLEDYLVAVYEITKKQPAARVSQIARRLGVSLPSVTNAMKRLSDLGFVNYEKYNMITLTRKGKERAKIKEELQSRFRDFFMDVIGLESAVSDKLARSFSHYVDESVKDRFDKFYEIIKDFNEKKTKELVEFIEESRKLSRGEKGNE
ncbi:MAG: metal-dependent transcriptional regulator [Thermotogaceae bacterium]|nr:metal-dependent transcriptional regulator [Thermotogaceae bacterium]